MGKFVSSLEPRPPSYPEGGRLQKEWHYLFIGSILIAVVCALALLNATFRFSDASSYNPADISGILVLAGYLGMFISMWLSPVPDYILVPVYGYLCSIGIFNPYATFLVCMVAALVPIEYVSGRYAGRTLLLRGLSYLHIRERDIEVADRWLADHGKFSIFTATFIPFFYSVIALAAGTLKMRASPFFLSSTAGFGLRYAFLEYVGFYSIYVFTASFDYSHRGLFALLLIPALVYAGAYLVRSFRSRVGLHYRADRTLS